MAKFVRLVTTIHNNWKKSLFGAVVISYGTHYAKGKHECNRLMAEYCREAQMYGDSVYRGEQKIREVVVFLNPAANKRKAKKNFEKYCAPLLNLAGIFVSIVQTKSQGEARLLAEQLGEAVDAVIVAGGDGTLSETVTGILRRETSDHPLSKRIPVGVLPLGQTNNVAKYLFSGSSDNNDVKSMAEATMAVIREVTKPVDVIQINQLEKDKDDQRPVYSVSGLSWGALHDAYAKRDKYWYWGSLRSYMSYIFMGLREDGKGVTWNCNADLCYSLPCSGCSNCYVPVEPKKKQMPPRWWQSFVPKQNLGDRIVQKLDYSKIKNDECRRLLELQVSSVDLSVTPLRIHTNKSSIPSIQISIGPPTLGYWEFVTRGWQFLKGDYIKHMDILEVKDVKLQPKVTKAVKDAEHWFYIDNDDYELKPVYIKLLPNRVIMFCNKEFL